MSAALFNNDNIVVNYNGLTPDSTQSFSFRVRFRIESLSSDQTIIDQAAGSGSIPIRWLYVTSDGRLRTQLGNSGVFSSSGHVVIGIEYDVTIRYQVGGNVRFYSNGVLVAQGSIGSHDCDGDLYIGQRADSSLPFYGNIGWIGIWNTLLDPEQASTLYNGGSGSFGLPSNSYPDNLLIDIPLVDDVVDAAGTDDVISTTLTYPTDWTGDSFSIVAPDPVLRVIYNDVARSDGYILNAGYIEQNDARQLTIKIVNDGLGDDIVAVSLGGDITFDTDPSGELLAGSESNLVVDLDTSTLGSVSGTITITSLDPARESTVITVVAEVVDDLRSVGWSQAYNALDHVSLEKWFDANCGYQGYYDATLGRYLTESDLTPSGSVSSTHDGQIIERLNVTGEVLINHNNVTVRQCAINYQGNVTAVRQISGESAIIQHCTISGSPSPATGIGVRQDSLIEWNKIENLRIGIAVNIGQSINYNLVKNLYYFGVLIVDGTITGTLQVGETVTDSVDGYTATVDAVIGNNVYVQNQTFPGRKEYAGSWTGSISGATFATSVIDRSHNTAASCHGGGDILIYRNFLSGGNSAAFSLYPETAANTNTYLIENLLNNDPVGSRAIIAPYIEDKLFYAGTANIRIIDNLYGLDTDSTPTSNFTYSYGEDYCYSDGNRHISSGVEYITPGYDSSDFSTPYIRNPKTILINGKIIPKVTTSDSTGTVYAYLSESAIPPSRSDLISGTGAIDLITKTVTESGEIVLDDFTGLIDDNIYYTHFLHVNENELPSQTETDTTLFTESNMQYTGSLYYGPVDTGLSHSLQSPTLPDADWSIVYCIRLHHLSRNFPDQGEYPSLQNLYYTSGSSLGGNDSWLQIHPDNFFSKPLRRCLRFRMARSGVVLTTESRITGSTQLDRNKTYIVVVQRNGSTIQMYVCEQGGSAILDATGTYNAAFGSRHFGTMNVGLTWGNYLQFIATGAKALTTGEIETIAAGGDLESIYSAGQRLSYHEFNDPTAATINDQWGANNATRVGDWSAQPTTSPILANATARIECDELPPFTPIGIAKGEATVTVPVSGTYTGFTPATFQYRLLNAFALTEAVGWTNLNSFSASAGDWSGEITGIPAGNYVLQIRDGTDTAKIWRGGNPFTVCVIGLTTGQSPMTILESSPEQIASYSDPFVLCLSALRNEIYPAKYTATTGYEEVAKQYYASGGNQLCLIPAAVSGTSAAQWAAVDSTQWADCLARIDVASPLGYVYILWLNGASEGAGTTTPTDQDGIYSKIESDIETARGLAFSYTMIPHQRQTSGTNNFRVRDIQKVWAESHADYGSQVFVGPWMGDIQMDSEDIDIVRAVTSTTTQLAEAFPVGAAAPTNLIINGEERSISAWDNSTRVATHTAFSVLPTANVSQYICYGTGPHQSVEGNTRMANRIGHFFAYMQGVSPISYMGPSIDTVTTGDGNPSTTVDVNVTHVSGTALRTLSGGDPYGFEGWDGANWIEPTSTSITSATTVRLVFSSAVSKVRYLPSDPIQEDKFQLLDSALLDNTGVGDTEGLLTWYTTDVGIDVTQGEEDPDPDPEYEESNPDDSNNIDVIDENDSNNTVREDVINKVIPTRNVRNGYAISYVSRTGYYQRKNKEEIDNVSFNKTYSIYNNRFPEQGE